jgi:osmotically-inducible protein OsmY
MTCIPTWHDDRAYDTVVRRLATMALERSAADRHVDAFVSHGCVILSGTVDSDGKKIDAELAVRGVPGITGVLNCIEVRSGSAEVSAGSA